MQIKKYIALTLKEASQKMKDELGVDAIVLSTRIIDDDPRYGHKRVFELTAGVEDDYDKSRAKEARTNETRASEPRAAGGASKAPRAQSPVVKPQARQKTFAEELQELSEKVYQPADKETELQALKQKIIKAQSSAPGAPASKAAAGKKDVKKDTLERELKEISDTLIAREVQKSIVDVIIDQLGKYTEFLQPSNIDSYVISTISSMIPTSAFEVQKKQKTKVIALVGPTGVGKTTCIAKLAVISKILHNLNIGLISLDTFRLGAIDQLKIFSEISNIEMRVAYDAKEIPGIISEFRKKDIVFIDTAGRSQNNAGLLKETSRFLASTKVDEVYLVLSTTSTTKNILDVAQKFKVLNYNGVVFTKLDEAVSFGNILNITANFNVPIKYLTNGQIIPDDIIAADPQFIANMIYTGKISK